MSNEKMTFKTISSKFTHYLPDGLGRDSYITGNNGGLLRNVQFAIPKEAFNVPKTSHLYHIKKEASAVKYRSDGSGRDTYVTEKSGGLVNDFNSAASFHLGNILRNYSKAPVRQKVHNPALYITKKELMYLKNTKKQETKLINRLYWSEKFKFTKKAMNTTDSLSKLNTERSVRTSQTKERYDSDFLKTSVEKIMNYENKKKLKLKPLDNHSYEVTHLRTVN